ncbi:hypothetical protein NMY22_g17592 [Coprinellus aureogranulatus]|nr:hypothetical protein NMY22_g17592 [Coprinellus aureogranulatus]
MRIPSAQAATISLLLAAVALADDVTLYRPDASSTTTGNHISVTGDQTVRPVSTAANGQTAYEVQFTTKGMALINAETTSTMEFESKATTYTFFADATKYNVAHTVSVSVGDAVFVSEQECIKHDDGNIICVVKGEQRLDETTTTVTTAAFTTVTGAAVPWYTLPGPSTTPPNSIAPNSACSGSGLVWGILMSIGLGVGFLLV